MRRTLLAVLLTFILAPLAWGQDCKWCDMPIEGKKVMWARYAFCSQDCRQEWYEDQRRCKICNERVEPRSNRRTDGVHVIIITRPTWDGYCDFCRDGVKSGAIDPVKDRYVAPKEDDDEDADDSDDAAKVKVESQVPTPEGEDGSRDYLTWILGVGCGAIFLVAKMLR